MQKHIKLTQTFFWSIYNKHQLLVEDRKTGKEDVMKKRTVAAVGVGTLTLVFAAVGLSGCGSNQDDGVVTIEMVQYKPEAVDVFK